MRPRLQKQRGPARPVLTAVGRAADGGPGFPSRTAGLVLGLVLLAAGVVPAASSAEGRLRPDPSRLAETPPELQARLREDPFAYFRFVNAEWARRVCAVFRDDLPAFPSAILHGDAHVGQYAVTATAYGLDDFDDAAHGPSAIDIVRFLGSVDLITRRRAWTAERERLFDSFFDGYVRAISNPAYTAPEPAVAKRLRARPSRTTEEFFAWVESLIQPVTKDQFADLSRSLGLLEGRMRLERPELAAGYFQPKKIGWLRFGVGSALGRKVLARIEGPTADSADDVLLEAKELSRLDAVPCLQVPISDEVVRVIDATRQIGRIRHEILLVVPRRDDQGPELRDWWVRDWDETYKEVTLPDLGSAAELAELVRDAGGQLGSAKMRGATPDSEAQLRRTELAAVRRFAPRMRSTARRLTDALLAGWEEYRKSQPRRP